MITHNNDEVAKLMRFEALKEELKNRNINLSYQRLKILEYLAQNQCHPTVDQIFTDIQKHTYIIENNSI